MSISSTNYVDFAYVEEVTAGTTPATPTFKRLPITSVGLGDTLSTAVSKVIRSDRQTDDLIIVDSEVTGDCAYELSYAPFKPLLSALLQNDTVVSVNIAAATDIAAVNSSSSFTSSSTNFSTAGIVVGMFIKVAGFATAGANGFFKVTSVAASAIAVSPAPADDAAGDTVTITSEMIRNGADTPKSYTFRKQLNAPSADDAIFYYRGCVVNSMSMNFATGAILEGSLNVVGLTTESTDTAIAGETINEPDNYVLMNSVSSIAAIDIEGLPAATSFSSMDLSISNQVTAAKAIGVLGAASLTPYSLDITGNIEIYFVDTAVYNIYKNATAFSVALRLVDSLGNTLIVYLPKCKFESLSEPVDGKDNFLMESGSLRALRDTTTNAMVQFCFFPAA